MADEHGLSPNWINEDARPFIGFEIADERHFIDVSIRTHTIRVASRRALLAMKMARYARKDYADITALIRPLGLDTADEVVDLTVEVLGIDSPAIPEGRDDLMLRAEEALRRVTRGSSESSRRESR